MKSWGSRTHCRQAADQVTQQNRPILLWKFFEICYQLACCHRYCKWFLGVSLLTLAWQFFTNCNPHARNIASYYFYYLGHLSMPETVGSVVRNRDLVVLKSQNFLPGMFVDNSQECSHCAHTLAHHRGSSQKYINCSVLNKRNTFGSELFCSLRTKDPSIALWEMSDSSDKSSVRVSPVSACWSLPYVGLTVLLPQLWWDGCCSLPACLALWTRSFLDLVSFLSVAAWKAVSKGTSRQFHHP